MKKKELTQQEIKLYKKRMASCNRCTDAKTTVKLTSVFMEGNPAPFFATLNSSVLTEYYLLDKMVESEDKYQPCLSLIKNTLETIHKYSNMVDFSCIDLAELDNLCEKFNATGNEDYMKTFYAMLQDAYLDSDDDACNSLLGILFEPCRYLLGKD